MARPDYIVKEAYVGNGSADTYDFEFKIENLEQLLVVVANTDGEEVERVRGDDTTFLDSVTFNAERGGGEIVLQANLPSGYRLLILLANDEPTQPYEFRQKGSFTLERIEWALDFIAGAVQRLAYLTKKSIKVNDLDSDSFETMIPPVPNDGELKILELRDDRSGLRWTSPAAIVAEGSEGSSLPVGGATGAILAKQSDDDLDVAWEQFDAVGFSQRYNESVNLATLRAVIDYIFNFGYVAPQISLSASGSGTIREKGDVVTATTLTAAITKRTDPIAEVRFYLNPSTLLDTQSSGGGIPDGGNSVYNWTGSFSDNTSFRAEVDDDGTSGGPSTIQSNASFTFVYPYYVGAGAVGLAASSVAGLTKRIIANTNSRAETISAANGQVFYFAFPASYGALTSILDVNNFETFSDWTERVENITGLDGNPVSYRIYEFENPVVAGSYTFTFKR